jgi:hypothetical protein
MCDEGTPGGPARWGGEQRVDVHGAALFVVADAVDRQSVAQ